MRLKKKTKTQMIMDFHFSAKFNDREFVYHGCFFIKKITPDFISKFLKNIIDIAKIELAKKCKTWEIDLKNISSFEIYYFKNGSEINIFNWKI